MTKDEAQKVADSLSENQKYALRYALCNGEEYRQEHGQEALYARNCNFGSSYRSHIAAATRRALANKGLLTGKYSFQDSLTSDGMKVAKLVISDWFDDEDGERPANLAGYVSGYLKKREAVVDEHAEKVKRAKRLWRGLSTTDYGPSGRIAVSTEIEDQFGDGSSRRLGFSLDDLIEIGEQIEKLR